MKKNKKRETIEKTRLFPCWARSREERWLERQAAAGHELVAVSGCVYGFKLTAPRQISAAVEFVGKNPDVPEEIAFDCNCGWDFIGRFGSCRYYSRPADGEPLAHPASDSRVEPMRLASARSNLTTLAMLNVPCAIYCLIYLVLFLGDGFSFADLADTDGGSGILYLIGSILGIASIYFFCSRLIRLSKRTKEISLKK